MPELDADALRDALTTPAGPYRRIDVVPSTGSTNADLREAAVAGAEDRTVLIAGEQISGVGRLGRTWVSPAGTGLYLSVLLRPKGVPPEGIGSLAMVAGLALKDVCDDLEVDATLKWPNDLLAAGGGKLAGVLSELVPALQQGDPAVVLGIGLNVLPLGDVPPGPGGLPATSLADCGASTTDPTEIAAALLRSLDAREAAWRSAGGDLHAAGLLEDYRSSCATIGTDVEVSLPEGRPVSGRAVDVDAAGQLLVQTDGGTVSVFAGDVVHLR